MIAPVPLWRLKRECGADGSVSMCVRTCDPQLIAALQSAEGTSLMSQSRVGAEVLRAQPHRVLASPVGRVEVFQPIPPPDGQSPNGPHTHLLPKLIAKHRYHSANAPIPEGAHSALTAHPRSAWPVGPDKKRTFDSAADAAFEPILERFQLSEDREVGQYVLGCIGSRRLPEQTQWPETRRGRTKARIVLRRLAAAGDERVKPWRALHDHSPLEISDPEDPTIYRSGSRRPFAGRRPSRSPK